MPIMYVYGQWVSVTPCVSDPGGDLSSWESGTNLGEEWGKVISKRGVHRGSLKIHRGISNEVISGKRGHT